MDQAVQDLLEQEEKKALAKQAAQAAKSNNEDHVLRRIPNDDYSSEREKNNERRRTKSIEVKREDQDVDMRDADSGRPGSANGSMRSSRHGHRSRSPTNRRRESSRDRYRERDDRDTGIDSYRPEGSRRGGDRRDDRRDRDGRGRGGRDADRPTDRRRSDDDRRYSRGNGYDRRDPAYRRDDRRDRKPKTPEPTDDERDRRTVFVQQLAARLRTKQLQEFFEQVGTVVEAQIVKDRVSNRSKGVGYVEFKDEESVQKAIGLTGQKLLNIPIIAQLTEAEKNRQARTTDGHQHATQSNGIPFHRLYVGNIHFSITEEDLRDVFEPFGELEFVQLQKEEQQGRSKGYGFVQFIDPAQAKEALEKMNGFELAGRPIRVGLGNDKFTPESTQSLLQRFGNQAHQAHHAQNFQGSQFSGMGGRGSHAGGTGNFDRASGRDAEKAGGASALDDTDVAGVNFSNYSRDALMRKLARTDESSTEQKEDTRRAAAPVRKVAPIHDVPTPSRCVLLKNVHNKAEESAKAKAAGENDDDWQKELTDDVKIECQEKYGQVMHIGLGLDSDDGEIYIKFDRAQGGENAIRGLNGRYFGGRQLTAQYVVDAVYNMNFPNAKNL